MKGFIKRHRYLVSGIGASLLLLIVIASLGLSLDFTPPLVKNGVELMEQGRLEEAIAKFDEAIHGEPICAKAYANRAKAYILLGKEAEAQRDIDTAVAQGTDRGALERDIEALKQQSSAR